MQNLFAVLTNVTLRRGSAGAKRKVLNASLCRCFLSSAADSQLRTNDKNSGRDGIDDDAETFGVMDSFPNGHRVMIIHPKIRWGRNSASSLTTAELQLEEAIALVKTIPSFTLASAVVVGTDYSTKTKRIWGAGRIKKLIENKEKAEATAVMVNVKMLSPHQQVELSTIFHAPVFDRYNIVLLIFKLFAKTKDAWLQIELASIPYIRARMKCVDALHVDPEVLQIKFPSFSKMDKFEVLRFREHEVRKKIKASVEAKRCIISDTEKKRAAALIAVVGYTNSGKSSLIKRLSGKPLHVEDRLFATLDASAHFCRLPSGATVHFADTVGFISDLPTQLFASFEATLSYVSAADLILIVEDVSHPDRLAQRETVFKTLRELKIKPEVLDSSITIANKVDKLTKAPDESDVKFISCFDGRGLSELVSMLDKKVMQVGGRVRRMLKLRPGSEALNYLFQGSFLVDETVPTSDGNYLLCTFVMNEPEFAKFSSKFPIRRR